LLPCRHFHLERAFPTIFLRFGTPSAVLVAATHFPASLAAGLWRRHVAGKRRTPIREKDLKGLKYFKVLAPLLERLHACFTQDGLGPVRDEQHRAATMHLHFDVVKNIPTHVSVTTGNGSERDQLRAYLKPGGFYVFDRGYRDWALFQEIASVG
jgi:hypothetical protein